MSEPHANIGTPLVKRDLTDLDAGIVLEMKNGLPVVPLSYYESIRYTDIRKAGDRAIVAIDFQGYVRTPDGDYYVDALVANGILRDSTQEGIYLETRGVDNIGYTWHLGCDADAVKRYESFITISPMLQERLGVVVTPNGNCIPEEDFLSSNSRDKLKTTREKKHGIAIDLDRRKVKSLDPLKENDPLARQKAEVIHNRIVNRLLAGMSPLEIEAEVILIEEALRGITPDELNRRLTQNTR